MGKGFDIAKVLSTPRELCKTCIDWYEGDDDTYPLCVNGRYECRNYLLGYTDTCPCYFEF